LNPHSFLAKMKPEYRTLLAFLAASVVPATYMAIAFPLSGEREPGSILGTFIVVYYFSALATGLVGLPAFLLLSKFRLVTWWSSLSGGALAGAITLFAILGGVETTPALRFVALGSVSGLAFWFVWKSGQAWPTSRDVV